MLKQIKENSPRHLLNVLCAFNLRLVSRGSLTIKLHLAIATKKRIDAFSKQHDLRNVRIRSSKSLLNSTKKQLLGLFKDNTLNENHC